MVLDTNAAAGHKIGDACSKGEGTFQTMQIVFFPLAAVAGGLGIYLVATSGKSAPRTGFNVNPQVGPGNGKLDLLAPGDGVRSSVPTRAAACG